MFFESHHSTGQNFLKISTNESTKSFPLHIHRAFECYAVLRGEARVTVDAKEYIIGAGEAVLVFPYQSHEYTTTPDTATWMCIFSPDLVGGYGKNSEKAVPTSAKFKFSPEETDTGDSLLLKKALCYRICGKFDENAEYTSRDAVGRDVVSRMLLFISENYMAKCTLADVASAIGYDYSYISKLFMREVGISFNSYVNTLKISEACRLLEEGAGIQSVCEQVGYSCTRTFHREFLKVMGATPSSYLNNQIR